MADPQTLLRASYVLPAADANVIEDGALVWRDETLVAVGDYTILQREFPTAEQLTFSNHVALPGLVNAHDHGRGLGTLPMGVPDMPLELWLPGLWILRPLDSYLAALYDGLLLLASGVTSTFHQHNPRIWPSTEDELLDTARGYRDAGIRASISFSLLDQNTFSYIGNEEFLASLPRDLADGIRKTGMDVLPPPYQEGIAAGLRLADRWRDQTRTCFAWGPTAPQWCSDELLQAVREVATDETPIQTHLVETRYQRGFGERFYGKTPLAHLADTGFLGPNVSLAHGVWLTDEDIETLANSGAMVAHNPSSNLRLRSGIAPVLDLIDAGVTVGIGLDGQTLNDDQDMWTEMRLARGLAFEPGLDGRHLTAQQVLHMATEYGARIAGGPVRGRLEAGHAADVIVLNLNKIRGPYLDERTDLLEAIVGRAKPASVEGVIVGGELQIRDGVHLREKLSDVQDRIRQSLDDTPKDPHQQERERLASALLPHLRQLYADW